MRQIDQTYDLDLETFIEEIYKKWDDFDNSCYDDIEDFFSNPNSDHALFFDKLKKYFTRKFVEIIKNDNSKTTNLSRKYYDFFESISDIYQQLPDEKKKIIPSVSDFFAEIVIQLQNEELFDFVYGVYDREFCFDKKTNDTIFEIFKQNPRILLQKISLKSFLLDEFLSRIPELAFITDELGNSLLFYLSQNLPAIQKILLQSPEAKLIRANKELKNRLILMVATLDNDSEIDSDFLRKNLEYLNQPDETGKTALHYAIILGKEKAVKQLLKQDGIDFAIQDKSGRNALHYLIIENKSEIFDALSTKKDHQEMFDKAINQQDVFGLSSMAMACLSGFTQQTEDETDINKIWQYAGYKKESEFDKLFYEICLEFGFVDKTTGKISLEDNSLIAMKQKLETIYRRFDIDENVKQLLFCAFYYYADNIWEIYRKSKAEIDQTTEFQPFGIELELVNLYSLQSTPLVFIEQIYNVKATEDGSVRHSITMYRNNYVQEIVSDPIKNQKQFELFLKMCDKLEASGTMVNQSTGLHIHINFNNPKYGKLVDRAVKKLSDQNLYDLDSTKLEFLILKQIIINFSFLQCLLQNLMRNGLLFDDQSYSKLILSDEDKIKLFNEAKNIKNLLDTIFSDRNLVLNLQNIEPQLTDGKGTLEFRCHEGAINPTIIKAWVNFIQRLVAISVDQVVDALNQDPEKSIAEKIDNFKFEPSEEDECKNKICIEDLFYLFIAERQYQNTWDAKLGSVPSQYDFAAQPIAGEPTKAKDPDPIAGKIAQEIIQDSPFYLSIQQGKILEEVKDPQDIEQLGRIFEIQKQHPGILPDHKALTSKDSPYSSPKAVTKDALVGLGLDDTPFL